MEVSAELFLLDNLLMDWLMLRLAAAIGGLRLRPWLSPAAALLGAVYALLSLTALPVLNRLPCKLALCVAAALPLVHAPRDLPRAILALFVAACFLGGLLFALCMLLGGSLAGGVLVGTVPLRAALLGAVAALVAPRLVRSLTAAIRNRSRHVLLRVVLQDRTLLVQALADSGNLLTEPLTGKPVVILDRSLLPDCGGGRPVPYATLGGEGFLYAIQPRLLQAYVGGWHAIDALVAASDTRINGTQAIIDSALLPKGRRDTDVQTHMDVVQAAVSAAPPAAAQAGAVHSFGGDAAGSVSGGGGTGLDHAPEGGRTDGEERID